MRSTMVSVPLFVISTLLPMAYGSAIPQDPASLAAGPRPVDDYRVVSSDADLELLDSLDGLRRRAEPKQVDDYTVVESDPDLDLLDSLDSLQRRSEGMTKTQSRAKRLEQALIESMITDENRPFQDSEHFTPTNAECRYRRNPGKCVASSPGFLRKELYGVGVPKVYTEPHVDEARTNMDDKESITLTVKESTAISSAASSGWNIGLDLEVKLGESATPKFTFGYKKEKSKSYTETREVQDTLVCGPRKRCTWETHTYRARIKGLCKQDAKVECGDQLVSMCSNYKSWAKSCQRHTGFTKTHCEPTGPREVECEIDVPLYNRLGKPLTELVWNPQPLADDE